MPLNNWDELGSNVWVVTANRAPTYYQDGDLVTFDDTASNFVVNLAATVAPAAVLVSNNVHSYTLSGNGSIASYSGLTKSGTAALTLTATNTYSGATVDLGRHVDLGHGDGGSRRAGRGQRHGERHPRCGRLQPDAQ